MGGRKSGAKLVEGFAAKLQLDRFVVFTKTYGDNPAQKLVFHLCIHHNGRVNKQVSRLNETAILQGFYNKLLLIFCHFFEHLFANCRAAKPDIHHPAVVGYQRVVGRGCHLGGNNKVYIYEAGHIDSICQVVAKIQYPAIESKFKDAVKLLSG